MIASPCKDCPKKNLPKSDCAKDCNLLKAVQNVQISAHENGISDRQDYCTKIEYEIPQSFQTTADLL